MIIEPAIRTMQIEEYYFSKKLQEIATLNQQGRNIISLGIGSPDLPPAPSVIDVLNESSSNPQNHAYQSYKGIDELREAFSLWYKKHYGVTLNHKTEIQLLTGSKEGILLLSMAFLNTGDKVLIPNPAYPTYTSAALLCEAEPIYYNLDENNNWEPDFNSLEHMDLSDVKMMWSNYPHMPTGANVSTKLYEKLVAFGRRNNILICNDNPYSFLLTDKPRSILAVEGAKDCAVELNSLSKTFNMAGWRIGVICGDKDIIHTILKVKSNMDSGIFKPLQLASIEALSLSEEWFKNLNKEYAQRQIIAATIFDILDVHYDKKSSGMFLWGKVSKSWSNGEELSDFLLYEAGVFITPGFIFGSNGDKYIRISLCSNIDNLNRAYDKIKLSLNKN